MLVVQAVSKNFEPAQPIAKVQDDINMAIASTFM
jgi:hypothetical protein